MKKENKKNDLDIEIVMGDDSELKFSEVEDSINVLRPKDNSDKAKKNVIIPKTQSEKEKEKENK